MADILREIVQAYYNDIQTELDGGALSDFQAVLLTEPPLPQDFSIDLPCLLLWGATVLAEPMCLGGDMYRKEYDISLTVLSEKYDQYDGSVGLLGDDYVQGLYRLMATLETRYRNNALSVSLGCIMLEPLYSDQAIAPFVGTCYGIHTFKHYYSG